MIPLVLELKFRTSFITKEILCADCCSMVWDFFF